jgi:hypothetical protein
MKCTHVKYLQAKSTSAILRHAWLVFFSSKTNGPQFMAAQLEESFQHFFEAWWRSCFDIELVNIFHTSTHIIWTIYKLSNDAKGPNIQDSAIFTITSKFCTESCWIALAWAYVLLPCSLQLAPTSSWVTPRLFPHRLDSAQSMLCSLLPPGWSKLALQRTQMLIYSWFWILSSTGIPPRLLMLDAYTSSNHISSKDTNARSGFTQHQEQSHCVVLSLWIPAKT